MTSGDVSILMYHAVGDGPAPLYLPAATFRRQIDTLASEGYRGISLREYVASRDTARPPGKIAVLTFDDGTRDFADTAWPVIESHGWSCTVFLSSGLVGDASGWDPDGHGARPLIDWSQAADLAAAGVEIGAHGVTHTDLTSLEPARVQDEVAGCRPTIEQRTGTAVTSFAAPYGRTTPAIRTVIARHYACAVGTALARATPASDRYDLPRIEMWYFRSPARWRAFLRGASGYLSGRRLLRHARRAILRDARGGGAPRN